MSVYCVLRPRAATFKRAHPPYHGVELSLVLDLWHTYKRLMMALGLLAYTAALAEMYRVM